jgi:hypothetical protein
MKRNILILMIMLCLVGQPIAAITMDQSGLSTPHGFVPWEDLVKMPARVRTLQRLYIATVATVIGVIGYKKWHYYKANKAALKKDMAALPPFMQDAIQSLF